MWCAESGERIIFTQPTKKLLKKSLVEMEKLRKKAGQPFILKLIDSDDSTTTVRDITTFLNNGGYPKDEYVEGKGVVLLCTNEAFFRLPYFDNEDKWHLIMDEPTDLHEHRFILPLPLLYEQIHDRFLANYLTSVPSGIPGYDLLQPNNDAFDTIAANKDNDRGVRDLLSPLLCKLRRRGGESYWKVYVREGHGLLTSDEREFRDTLVADMIPTPAFFVRFKTTTLIAANIENQFFLHYYMSQGIQFIEHSLIAKEMEKQWKESGGDGHNRNHLIQIYYGYWMDWSKRARDRDGGRKMKALVKAIVDLVGDRQFLYIANKDVPRNIFVSIPGANDIMEDGYPRVCRMDNKPHGRNDYRHRNIVVVLTATLPTPSHSKFLQEVLGLTDIQIRNRMMRDTIHQAVTRSSIRDPENEQEKLVIVPDVASSEYESKQFPGCPFPKQLDIRLEEIVKPAGRPKVHANAAERQRAYWQRNTEEKRKMKVAERMKRKRAGGNRGD